ncbi:MAG: RagB/SusD family nutrient uptake outer membrane protein [Tunicatimonas sp.]
MKSIKYSILLWSAVWATSCDVLNQEPVSEIASVNFFQTASDAEAAIVGCYDGFQGNGFVSMLYVLQPIVASDETYPSRGGNYTRINTFEVNANQGDINNLWQVVYSGVHRCNDVLANVPGITDPAIEDDRDRILGEAYFLRAYHFWHLTRWWGKIPLPLQVTTSAEGLDLPREERSVVYDQIISDLEEAERLLPDNTDNRAMASKAAARALMARVFLFRNQEGDYANALEETTAVLDDNFYTLVSGENYGDLFEVGKQNTVETIFEISVRPNVELENQGLDGELVPAAGNNFRVLPEQKILDAFAENPEDLRIPVTLDTVPDTTTLFVNKWTVGPVEQVDNRRLQDPNVVLLRLADVILMHAESLNELGQTGEAIPFLNQIRTRAGLEATTAVSQEEVRQAIRNERFLELAFEGIRWFDLVRWDIAVQEVEELDNPDRILWPVPVREIDLNPNLLPQNPSY